MSDFDPRECGDRGDLFTPRYGYERWGWPCCQERRAVSTLLMSGRNTSRRRCYLSNASNWKNRT